ncbi:MAG: hypothetical protein ACREJC_10790 [Tepidisphaeraceae bacterium]
MFIPTTDGQYINTTMIQTLYIRHVGDAQFEVTAFLPLREHLGATLVSKKENVECLHKTDDQRNAREFMVVGQFEFDGAC